MDKTPKKRNMYTQLVNTDKTIQKINQNIRYVKQHIFIGTPIKLKVEGGGKFEYRILKLKCIQGNHYIFQSKYGWLQSYTLKQLCFDVANGNIKIVEEEKSDDKK